MRIRRFLIDSDEQVVVKVLREVLDLYRISVADEAPAFEEISVRSETSEGNPLRVRTEAVFIGADGTARRRSTEGAARAGENPRAERHRLIKLNFYRLLREELSLAEAPWGILYGVRPSKIVHRWLDSGLSRSEIIARLSEDYGVGEDKAALLVDSSLYQRPFLRQSDSRTVSIYAGIPFCPSRCLYCSFPAFVLPGEKMLRRFTEVFFRDLAAVREAVARYGFRVQNIYVGGGTPTSLPDKVFDEVLRALSESFGSDALVEFCVEAGRPDSLTPAKLESMVRCRVNRVSANPQTMQARTLRRIGRRHEPEDIVRMVSVLRAAGIPCVNMDVIVGLPGEDLGDIEDTMEQIARLAPDDVTLHALAIKKGSRLKETLSETELPDDGTARAMFAVAMEHTRRMGLRPYYLYRQGYQSGQLENVGCCRSGAESMYNIQIMGERQTILGIGGAATSKIVSPTQKYLRTSFHPKEIAVYLDKVDDYIEKRARLLREVYGEQGD
ncbi:MAG: coproporphyrinogen dehydrogenase HemZ [Schwartzia sp.]|nr:coproporphyrinogen dehydrogenase HemZ [Schwartzia sp. (in: firmicutes)]